MTAGEVVKEFGLFDPRTREWYKKASNEKLAIFSPIYKHFVMYDLALSAAIPVYDEHGELLGVFGTHFPLTSINEFLAEIGKNYENITYIIDLETEEVIANSLGKQNFTVDSESVMSGININDIDESQILNFVTNIYTENSDDENSKYITELEEIILSYVSEGIIKTTKTTGKVLKKAVKSIKSQKRLVKKSKVIRKAAKNEKKASKAGKYIADKTGLDKNKVKKLVSTETFKKNRKRAADRVSSRKAVKRIGKGAVLTAGAGGIGATIHNEKGEKNKRRKKSKATNEYFEFKELMYFNSTLINESKNITEDNQEIFEAISILFYNTLNN
jgi:hypothetical protein